jgi:large subunit ribosomal protein L29
MNISELRELSNEELKNELLETRKEQFNLGMQKYTGQLSKQHLVKRARRKVAQIKTLMTERARSENE